MSLTAVPHAQVADLAPLGFAIRYADRGWRVFPCWWPEAGVCACPDGPGCGSPGKHPKTAAGFTDATTDAHQLTAWWTRWPRANIAIATGSVSGGLVVLDIDPRHGGGASLERLQRDHGALPCTASVRTGGGGAHVYFRAAVAVRSRVPLRGYTGLDLKAAGGYVVAPPSLHRTGRRYAWHRRERISDAPAWLVELANRETPQPTFDAPATTRGTADLEGVLRGCPRVRARFERDSNGLRDTSPSGVDLGLAAGLALLGFDRDAIAHAITESRARAGLPCKRPSYLRSTVSKALGVRM